MTIDADNDLARFVLTCNSINGDVLCLNKAAAKISLGEDTGLLVPTAAIHYLKEDGTEAEDKGENYIPGVYVKYGNIAASAGSTRWTTTTRSSPRANIPSFCPRGPMVR